MDADSKAQAIPIGHREQLGIEILLILKRCN
jgi:hypothetical protein